MRCRGGEQFFYFVERGLQVLEYIGLVDAPSDLEVGDVPVLVDDDVGGVAAPEYESCALFDGYATDGVGEVVLLYDGTGLARAVVGDGEEVEAGLVFELCVESVEYVHFSHTGSAAEEPEVDPGDFPDQVFFGNPGTV